MEALFVEEGMMDAHLVRNLLNAMALQEDAEYALFTQKQWQSFRSGTLSSFSPRPGRSYSRATFLPDLPLPLNPPDLYACFSAHGVLFKMGSVKPAGMIITIPLGHCEQGFSGEKNFIDILVNFWFTLFTYGG